MSIRWVQTGYRGYRHTDVGKTERDLIRQSVDMLIGLSPTTGRGDCEIKSLKSRHKPQEKE